ncbi:molybdopterin-containing oxidoreductase family protein [Bremerella sp. T1]|uniref:molybdopterin-containing oxidoreductase family protein n=1 Tax=Bremerella sp. TYQ1 TaxID=3119568 RepID=UPI001CCF1B65|nr:molybdopterin-dependent oxidoreductase [Bremerella volcania]UBM35961.1 molybdopterin-dependent oxidoreductase [Bremerella volcania]
MSNPSFNTNRRDWLKRTFVGAAGLGAIGHAVNAEEPEAIRQPSLEYDFTVASPALQADSVVRSACQFCNSLCGLDVHVKAGQVIDIQGVQSDPVQNGVLCVKGPMMTELLYNERRLQTPLRRVAGKKGDRTSRFEAISWQEALEAIADKLISLRDEGAAHTIVSRTSGRLPRGVGSLIHRMFQMLGSPNDTDVGPVCNDAGGNALAMTFGLGNFTNGYGVDESTGKEDLGSSEMFLFFGTNQAETHPVTFAHLLRQRDKSNAQLVVVDPRTTPTTSFADTHLAPKPHTDMALVWGMIRHIIDHNLYDKKFVKSWVLGFDQLVSHVRVQGYTTSWAADVCDIPEDAICALAEQYAKAKPAAIFCNAGISHQLSAFDTYRVLAILAAITGNVGVPGGGCNFMHNTWPGGLNLPPMSTPTPPTEVPAMPVGPDWFAESILHDRPYRMRALIVMGNPLLSSSSTSKVHAAFEQLEFFVYTGLFMEESAWYADIILPVCSGLEMDGVYMRRDDRAIRWQNAAASRVGQSKPDWEIWIDLAHEIAKRDTRHDASYWTEAFPGEWRNYENLWQTFVENTPGMGGMTASRMRSRDTPLQWPCPAESHPGVSTLYSDSPAWYEAATSLGHPGKRFLTPSGKIEVYTEAIERELAPSGHHALPKFYTHPEVTGHHPVLTKRKRLIVNPIHRHATTEMSVLENADNTKLHEAYPLMGIIGRPSVVHFAGMTQWTRTGKQLNGVRLIQLHPSVAAALDISQGDRIAVESPHGTVHGTVLLWEGIRADTIFVPNTFGPSQDVGDVFGVPRYEVANHLTDDSHYDTLSGQQAYKCFACRVRPA